MKITKEIPASLVERTKESYESGLLLRTHRRYYGRGWNGLSESNRVELVEDYQTFRSMRNFVIVCAGLSLIGLAALFYDNHNKYLKKCDQINMQSLENYFK